MAIEEERRFRALFDDNYRELQAYARRRLADPSDADDVVAEVFTIAWRRLEVVPIGPDARPYLYGIARNVVANQRRRRRREAHLLGRLRLQRPAADASIGPDDAVTRALEALAERDREILRLVAWEGLSHEEVALALGLTPTAVASRLLRARRRLAARMDTVGGDRTSKGEGARS